MTDLGQYAMFLAVAVGALGVFLGPIGRAVGRHIEGPTHGRPADDPAVRDLRNRVERLEAERARLAELEDRIDFTERVLAQQREPGRIEG